MHTLREISDCTIQSIYVQNMSIDGFPTRFNLGKVGDIMILARKNELCGRRSSKRVPNQLPYNNSAASANREN